MNKTCWNCQNFSLCDVSYKKCKDWQLWDKKFGKSMNLQIFGQNWLIRHKRWFDLLFQANLLQQRIEVAVENQRKKINTNDVQN